MSDLAAIGDLRAEFQSAEDARRFALAGDATLTLQSRRTGQHYTYNIHKPDDQETDNIRFVKVLGGDGRYHYLGTVRRNRGFSTTEKSQFGSNSPQARAFAYFWTWTAENRLPGELAVLHEGRCGRCGRPLTNPESIRTGLGPICSGLD